MILRSRDTSFTYSTPKKSSEAYGLSLKENGYVNSSTFTSNAVIPSNTWTCSNCTFENHNNTQRCSICSALRFSSYSTRTSTSLHHPFLSSVVQISTPSTDPSNEFIVIWSIERNSPSNRQAVFSIDSIHSSPETPQHRNIPARNAISTTPPQSYIFLITKYHYLLMRRILSTTMVFLFWIHLPHRLGWNNSFLSLSS